MSWNDIAEAGKTWDEVAIPRTEHESGLVLRAPRGTDVLPAGPTDPLYASKMVSWLVLSPPLEPGQAEALGRIVRRVSPFSAAPSSILAALPAAWLAYQRGER